MTTRPVAKVPSLPPIKQAPAASTAKAQPKKKAMHRGRHPIPQRASAPNAKPPTKVNPIKQSPAVTPVTPPAPTPPAAPASGTPGSPGTATIIDIKPPRVSEGIQPKNGTPTVSPSNAKGDLITALLFGLIIVNGVTSGQFQDIAAVVTKGKNADVKKSHHAIMMIGGELVFMVGLSLIAKMGDEAANFVMVFVLALWALWGVQNGTHIASFAKKVQ